MQLLGSKHLQFWEHILQCNPTGPHRWQPQALKALPSDPSMLLDLKAKRCEQAPRKLLITVWVSSIGQWCLVTSLRWESSSEEGRALTTDSLIVRWILRLLGMAWNLPVGNKRGGT